MTDKVKHTIGVIKRIFGFQKVRYRHGEESAIAQAHGISARGSNPVPGHGEESASTRGHGSARQPLYRAAPAAPCVGHVSIIVIESADPCSYPQAFPRKRASSPNSTDIRLNASLNRFFRVSLGLSVIETAPLSDRKTVRREQTRRCETIFF